VSAIVRPVCEMVVKDGWLLELMESVDYAALVIRDGDRVTATGRLVRDHTGDWFEPPLFRLLSVDMAREVSPAWRGAIRITGANFDDLSNRRERDGAVEGFAALTGIWSASQLRVETQAPPEPDPPDVRWRTPPCPAPEGGWPRLTWGRGDKNLAYDLGDLRETGAAVAVAHFRPSEDQAVLVVAAADVDAVEAQLRSQLGQLLCVIVSTWTTDELEAVRAHLHAHHEEWNLYQWGPDVTSQGQAQITALLTRVLPPIAVWADTLPAGILDLRPWLGRAQLA
jgi:hypothetical protein